MGDNQDRRLFVEDRDGKQVEVGRIECVREYEPIPAITLLKQTLPAMVDLTDDNGTGEPYENSSQASLVQPEPARELPGAFLVTNLWPLLPPSIQAVLLDIDRRIQAACVETGLPADLLLVRFAYHVSQSPLGMVEWLEREQLIGWSRLRQEIPGE